MPRLYAADPDDLDADVAPAEPWTPTLRQVWRVTRANLVALVLVGVMFGGVLFVLHHQAGERRQDQCQALAQALTLENHNLAIAVHADPNSENVTRFNQSVLDALKGC